MRQRLLTLSVMVAIVVSLVSRRVPAVAEVQKALAQEGLLWTPPLQVSLQALTKHLDVLPAAMIGTNSCSWASTARILARIHCGWSRCCGRACGIAI